MIDISLLKQLCETPGAPGFEKSIREIVIKEITPFVDDITIDNLGNVIALKKGKTSEKSVMLAAHMDEIGFIVTHIDDQGFIRFHSLGGFDPKTLTAQRVIIHGKKDVIGVMGSKPIHVMKPEEKTKTLSLDDFYIDTGMPVEEVKQWISLGASITRERSLIEMGECINCKSLDNRISVYVLIEALRRLQQANYDVYAVFTVQEEVGLRGAQVAAHRINPDFGIALDTTIAFDLPGAQAHEQITKLGKGAAIKIMDASTICDPRMVKFMQQVADQNQITYQVEVLTMGGTDTAGVQRMGKNGAIAGAISIPTRYLHQVIEMVHKSDVAGAVNLLTKALESIDQYDWSH
jgi:tetrahedral aminopeptidase